jgi:hypothetical protein
MANGAHPAIDKFSLLLKHETGRYRACSAIYYTYSIFFGFGAILYFYLISSANNADDKLIVAICYTNKWGCFGYK